MALPSSGPLSLNDIQGEFGGTNPIGMNEYYAGGGLVPSGTTGTFGAVPSSGALSIQNFYGTSNFVPIYIEEVFQTWLHTGNSSTQTITNGVNLSGNGGLVWLKCRSLNDSHQLIDTVRGGNKPLTSNNDAQAGTVATAITAFNTNGFTMGSFSNINFSAEQYVSWSFREQPKFFDCVTYTGNGSNRTIAHNLGSVPGCIIVKKTSDVGPWPVYHRSLLDSATSYLNLNTTGGRNVAPTYWNSTAPTSSVFSLGTSLDVNESGQTYVAYLFAHDAGGFGLNGTDDVISCRTYTGTGSTLLTVTLDWEPQWVMVKRSDGGTSDWRIFDVMRGMPQLANGAKALKANLNDAEDLGQDGIAPTATGFRFYSTGSGLNAPGATYIYIAIRRGPMKVPTTGTSVYNAIARTGTGANATITGVGFPPDLVIAKRRNAGDSTPWNDRLRGAQTIIRSSSDGAEFTGTGAAIWFLLQDGFSTGTSTESNSSGSTYINWAMRRAPGFFDEVCYTGNRAGRTLSHNLTVVPEMMIVKDRTVGEGWRVYHAALGASGFLVFETVSSSATDTNIWNNTTPTASVFSVGNYGPVNETGDNFVAYLFATCPGVSKVGSFTGTGATQVINCGFTGGARFVMIKATSTSGNWLVWDSARGIVAGNDPYLRINTDLAEITNTDWVDTDSTGFELSNAGGNLANTNGVSYIFLAIA